MHVVEAGDHVVQVFEMVTGNGDRRTELRFGDVRSKGM
jgi:hypothetical protein